ncbi:MAG: amidohydrolase [Planctomycetota bacterium]|nr:MAG: amidohydrolase [Planctomycetota bacterium]
MAGPSFLARFINACLWTTFVGHLVATGVRAADEHPAADLIVTGAQVWTGDEAQPAAEAVAVWGERVVAVGSNKDVRALRGPKTKIIDAGGRRLVPGFNDSHVHFFNGGRQLESVDLRDAASAEEMARRIGDFARKLPAGEWVVGGNWDDQNFDDPTLPTRQHIDRQARDTPVFVARYDGHMGVANSLALKLAGVTAETPDPEGGRIGRDADGQPTGILRESAKHLVERVIPSTTKAQRERYLRAALAHAARCGVTSVQTMSCSYENLATLVEVAQAGALTTRVYAAPLETTWRDQAKLGIRRAFGSHDLRIGALKGFADGSLGSRTAYFFQPYTDEPGNRGLLTDEMLPKADMLRRMTGADAAGLQLCIHAIGDRGISEVLDLFARVEAANGPRDRRFRIEHSQHVAPKDFSRYRALGVIASVQPYHAIDDGRWAEQRIGPERAKTTYAFRTFLDADVRLALGTDWPVAPLAPMLTIYAAATRATLDGRRNEGWVPEQKITVEEAVRAYTLGSAYAEFQEAEKGTIEVGKLADMVLLSEDIFAIDPRDIRDVHVEMTIVGGKVVWELPKKDRKQAP